MKPWCLKWGNSITGRRIAATRLREMLGSEALGEGEIV